MMPTTKKLQTPAGEMAYWDNGKDAPAVLFIHGNSASKEAFIHQFESPVLQKYRLVAIDLPGHGESDDVVDLDKICSTPTFAQIIASVIPALGLKNVTLVGWSLGGHIAIEIAGQGTELTGLVLTGTPPCGPGLEDMANAFIPSPHMALTGKPEFSDEEALTYARAVYNAEDVPANLLQGVKRAQGAVRATLLANFADPSSGHGQKHVVATTSVPIAVLQGSDDAFMSLDYFEKLKWNSLWKNKVIPINNTGHAPFWEKPDAYNAHLEEFLKAIN